MQDWNSIFLPAIYRVAEVQVLEGEPAAAEVSEVVPYEGLFCDIADAGQAVEVYGKLETVNSAPQRLVVGATQPASGTIRPLRAAKS